MGLISLFDNPSAQNKVGEISIPDAPKCDGAIYARGDSMYPILRAGDIVCYKTIHDIANIFWGEMYLIDIDIEGEQYVTIKYIQKSSQGDMYVQLVSHNANHQPKDILKSDIRALAMIKISIRYKSIG
jgi:phage repressor protein C with HTH and peptisase S24 domain